MKIRDRRVLAAAGWLGTGLVRILCASLRFEYRCLGPFPTDPLQPADRESFVYALWHEYFLVPVARFGNPGVAALVSRHSDGQLLGRLLRATGMGVVYGSTNRGGVAAVRELLRIETAHLAVTPDGPRGPRRVVQPGVVYLASRTARRIVPLGVGCRHPWRVGSWDRFAVPRPFSPVRCLFGQPLAVPPGLPYHSLGPYVARLQSELDRVTAAAQEWADSGSSEPPPLVAPAPTPSDGPIPSPAVSPRVSLPTTCSDDVKHGRDSDG